MSFLSSFLSLLLHANALPIYSYSVSWPESPHKFLLSRRCNCLACFPELARKRRTNAEKFMATPRTTSSTLIWESFLVLAIKKSWILSPCSTCIGSLSLYCVGFGINIPGVSRRIAVHLLEFVRLFLSGFEKLVEESTGSRKQKDVWQLVMKYPVPVYQIIWQRRTKKKATCISENIFPFSFVVHKIAFFSCCPFTGQWEKEDCLSSRRRFFNKFWRIFFFGY